MEGQSRLQFTLAPVIYADHHRFKASRNFLLGLIKRKAFAHEQEVRAITSLPRREVAKQVTGIEVKVDTRYLLTRVVTHPSSPEWFIKVVREVTRQNGLARSLVVPSGLKEPTSNDQNTFQSFHRSRNLSRSGVLVELPWRKPPPWKRRLG